MKINYILWSTKFTGGTRVIYEIVQRLRDKGHDAGIIAFIKEHSDNTFPYRIPITYVKRSLVSKIRSAGRFPVAHQKEIERFIPESDVTIASYWLTAHPVYLANKGKRTYHMQHHEVIFCHDAYLKKLCAETYTLPMDKFANSIWLQNQVKEKYNLDVPVITPGIDLELFRVKETTKVRDIEKDKTKKVLCLGRTEPWKGLEYATEAMEIVQKKIPNTELILFGRTNPNIPNVNYRFIQSPTDDELVGLYNIVDVVICPSLYESFPLPPLEAMACGTPIITTRYGTEDYAVHNKNALVVNPQDARAIAEQTIRVLENEQLRESLVKKGLETVKKYQWDNTIEKLEHYLKHLK
jgi:glycosyltransferase involved in cell wall biosynthesis